MNAVSPQGLGRIEGAVRRVAVAVERLGKTYDASAGPVLSDVSLAIEEGDIHGIIGRSGAGKSTLVRCLNGLVAPTTGRVIVAGREISHLSGPELRAARRGIGMIFQHFGLLSSRTVAGNVALPLELAGVPRAEIREKVPRLLDLVGLSAKADAWPVELSGGQKQRVGIARALALDPETTEQILDLLGDINRRLGLTVVLITHEMEVVRRIARHVSVLEAGRLVESGPTFDVIADPQTPVARSFLSSVAAHELPPELERRLLSAPVPGSHPVLRLVFTGPSAHDPVIAELVTRFEVRPNILYGRVDYVGGKALGVLTLALERAEGRLPDILAHLARLGLKGDIIGHVLGSSVAAAGWPAD